MVVSTLRSAAAVLVGLVAALAFVVGVEVVCGVLYPFPPGVDPTDCEVCRAQVARLPTNAFLIAVAGWGLAAFSGAWVTTRLGTGRHPAHGIAIGLLLLAGAVFNMALLPYPVWFWAANLAVLPASFFWATRLAQSNTRPQTA